jgi:phosphatidylinositol alpha-1,6-mannosyltransferase
MRYALLPYLSFACLKGGFKVALLAQWYSGAAASIAKRMGLLESVYAAAHGQELLRVPSEGKWLGRAYVKHRQRVLAALDGYFPVSRYTGSLLEDLRVPASKIHVVYNGTDVDRFVLSADERSQLPAWRVAHGLGSGPLLLTAARLVRRKGIDTVLAALPEIARRVPGVRYAVVGSGPEREHLEKLGRELGVAERVIFLGKLPDRDVVMAYNACDVFVMPARFEHPSVEGFGLVFREANACGKPVVGSRTGGIVDAIEDGRTGLLIEPDASDTLARAVLRLLEDPAYAAKLGEQGRELVVHAGTWQHAAERMLQVMGKA